MLTYNVLVRGCPNYSPNIHAGVHAQLLLVAVDAQPDRSIPSHVGTHTLKRQSAETESVSHDTGVCGCWAECVCGCFWPLAVCVRSAPYCFPRWEGGRKTIGRETAGTSSVCSRESNGRSELLSAFHSAFTRSKPPALFWRFLKHSGGRSFIAVQFFLYFWKFLAASSDCPLIEGGN